MNSMNTWILIPRYIALRTALYGAPKNETSARDQPNPIRRLVDGVGVGSRTRSNLITCRCCVFLEYATVQTRAWLTSLLYTSRTAQIPFVSPPPIGQRSIVMSVSVCVCVCLSVRDHIFGTTRPIFTKFFVHVSGDIGSVLLCRCCDTLYNFCFMDNVISRGCLTSPPSWSAVHTQPWAWL